MAPRGPEVPSFSPPATASRVLFLIHASFDQARWSWSTFTLNPIGSFGPAPSSSGQIWLMGSAEAHRVATVAAGGPVQVGALETSCRRRGVSVCRREKRGEIDRLVDVVRHWRDGFFAWGVSVKDIDHIAPAIPPDCFFFFFFFEKQRGA